eukprot:TRINITY_DN9650_c0_g1_i1.p1 TRINITY_DN9650_c0_g1~~TRINITY_DN9650_c0_g1_i1.p1  ORF type:complete len:655 (-),score=156.17 TRINITY_DN9650_c0_g1_i1:10-1974(-)
MVERAPKRIVIDKRIHEEISKQYQYFFSRVQRARDLVAAQEAARRIVGVPDAPVVSATDNTLSNSVAEDKTREDLESTNSVTIPKQVVDNNWEGEESIFSELFSWLTQKLTVQYNRFCEETSRASENLQEEVSVGPLEWFAKICKQYEKGVIVVFFGEDKYSRAYVKEWNRLVEKVSNQKVYLVGIYSGFDQEELLPASPNVALAPSHISESPTNPSPLSKGGIGSLFRRPEEGKKKDSGKRKGDGGIEIQETPRSLSNSILVQASLLPSKNIQIRWDIMMDVVADPTNKIAKSSRNMISQGRVLPGILIQVGKKQIYRWTLGTKVSGVNSFPDPIDVWTCMLTKQTFPSDAIRCGNPITTKGWSTLNRSVAFHVISAPNRLHLEVRKDSTTSTTPPVIAGGVVTSVGTASGGGGGGLVPTSTTVVPSLAISTIVPTKLKAADDVEPVQRRKGEKPHTRTRSDSLIGLLGIDYQIPIKPDSKTTKSLLTEPEEMLDPLDGEIVRNQLKKLEKKKCTAIGLVEFTAKIPELKPPSRKYFVNNGGITHLVDLLEQEGREGWRTNKQELQEALAGCLTVLLGTKEGWAGMVTQPQNMLQLVTVLTRPSTRLTAKISILDLLAACSMMLGGSLVVVQGFRDFKEQKKKKKKKKKSTLR